MSGSASVPSTVDANSATRCARITAPSGSYRYRRTGPTGAPDRPDPVRRTPDGSRVARRGTEASGPYQKQASTTSPSTDTHSASAPGGISAWSIPGESLSTVRGTRVESADTKSHGGEYAFGSNTRPEPVRRAGSQNTPSTVDRSTVVASAHATQTRESRPSTATLADATAAVNGSASTASTRIPARAKARGPRRGPELGEGHGFQSTSTMRCWGPSPGTTPGLWKRKTIRSPLPLRQVR